MIALVQVVSPAEYKAWLTQQGALITQANDQVAQLRAILTASGNLSAGGTSTRLDGRHRRAHHRSRVTSRSRRSIAHEVTRPRKTKQWVDWVLTTDHKKIGIMYLVLTFVFFMLGGVEALMMRMQLERAEQHAAVGPSTTTSCSRCTARR